MTLNEAIGIKSGEKITHREKYHRIIEFLGGLNAIIPYIPFTKEEIAKAIEKDPHLNNLSMKKWDNASGFNVYRNKYGEEVVTPHYHGLWNLYRKHGITSASNSTGVCILKEAATEWIEEEK